MVESHLQLLAALFLAHILFDFVLRPSRWERALASRGVRAPSLYLHTLLHGGAAGALFFHFFGNVGASFGAGVVVLSAHWVVKLLARRGSRRPLLVFVASQVAHGGVLLALWIAFVGTGPAAELVAPLLSAPALLVVLAYLLILRPTSVLIRLLLDPWLHEIPKGEEGNTRESLSRAGAVIGYLERFMVLTFVLLNQFAAIGFVLAIKTAFRFREMDDRKKAEYVMLGTFYSFTLTITLGLAVSLILAQA